jgi:tape measure domain-containing protein
VSGSTTTLDLKVTADAKAAVQGLKPLSASLDGVTKDAQQTESALKDLDKKHTIDLNDQAIETARKEISTLRAQMRDDLALDVNANTKAAQKRIRELQSTVRTLDAESIDIKATVQVDDAGVDKLGGLQAKLEGLDQSSGGMIPGLGSLAGGVGRLGGAASAAAPAVAALATVAAGWKLGEAAADVETMVVQLDALTKGHGAATMKDIQKWAALTPFAIEDAAEATKKLVAAGVDLQDIPDYLNDIGNIASATGVPIDQLGTVFAQMESKGKATYEELAQIAEAGVPVWATLADQLGMTTAEVQKLATEGKLGADAINLARESLADLYPTAMADQAKTFNGQMSTFQDTLSQVGSTLGTAVLPLMSSFLGSVNELANGLLWLSGKITGATDAWNDFRDSLKASRDDAKTTGKDFADLGTSPIWELPKKFKDIAFNRPDWFGGADKDAKAAEKGINDVTGAQKGLGDMAKETSDKIANSAEAQKAALKAAADAAKVYEQRLKEAITAFGQIGGNVRTQVSFLISRDDLQEQIDKAVKGEKGKKGIELPATITLGSVEKSLSDEQQNLVGLISSGVETGLQEGARRAEINPNFDAAAWYNQVREKTRGQLLQVGIDKSKVDEVLAEVFGLPKKVAVTADVSAAQADVNGITAPPLTITPTIVGPWAPGKGPAANFFAPQTVPVTVPPIPPPVITPTTNIAPAKASLDGVVKPRVAMITPDLNDWQATIVKAQLDQLAKDRHMTIHVTKTGGGAADAPSEGGTSIVPQLFGTDTRLVAGLRAASLAAPQMVAAAVAGTAAGAAARGQAQVTQLAPRQVPIKVYLDGAEIADHLQLRAGRLATVSSVRRRP